MLEIRVFSMVMVALEIVRSKWHEPIHHNKTIHYAYKVEVNVASLAYYRFYSQKSLFRYFSLRVNRLHRLLVLEIDTNITTNE